MKWDKNKGLNEEQRKQLALAEREQRESQKRLEENLPNFKEQYASVVRFSKIRHRAGLAFVEGTPEWLKRMIMAVARPILQLEECSKVMEGLEDEAMRMELKNSEAVDPSA